MPKLTPQEFAELVRSMPDASDDEIIAAAKQKEAESYSLLGDIWEKIRTPLTTLPSEVAGKVANWADTPELDDSPFEAKAKGFAAGAIQGAGDLASAMTSPLDIALTLTGMGGAAAGRRGLLGISRAARGAEAGLTAPIAAEGVYNAGTGIAEGNPAKFGLGLAQAAGGAVGMRNAATHAFPVQKVAEAYNQSVGLPKPQPHQPVNVNPDEAKAIADAFQAMPHQPDNPDVAASYAQLAKEIEDQFAFITERAGVKMEPWTQPGQPYANSAEMLADIQNNNTLKYFPTEAGYGEGAVTQQHPMLNISKRFGVPVNDLFRAVHDYFGHGRQGFQFGPKGEENAWLSHKATLTPESHGALTTETRGQNSWVNFGEHLRRPDGSIPSKGQEGFVPPTERPFAEQKAGLLPPEFLQRREASAQPSLNTPAAAAQAPLRSPFEDPQLFIDPQRSPLVDGSPYGILSPANPGGQPLPASENAKRVEELLSLVQEKQLKPVSQQGFYGGEPEPSFLIPGLQVEDTKALGRRFGQDAVISHEGWHRLSDDATFPRTGVGFDQDASDFYSVIDFPGHGPVKYQFDFPPEAFEPAPSAALKALEPPVQATTSATHGTAGPSPSQQGSTVRVADEILPPETAAIAHQQDPLHALEVVNEPRHAQVRPQGKDVETLASQMASRLNEIPTSKRKVGGGGTTAAMVAAPAAIASIPDDPESKWDDYGRIGLALAGAAGLGAAVRSKPLTGQKLFATQGAGLMLGGTSRKAWADRMLQMGVPKPQLEHIRAASQKMLDKQSQKIGTQMTSTKKVLQHFQTGKGEMTWYDDTSKELQELFGKDAEMVAGFLTATSINATVKSNISLAMKAYKQWKAGEPFSGFLPSVIKELDRVKSGQPLAGRKLDNFRRAILGDTDAVVVDRWMLRAFGDQKSLAATPHQYDLIENAVKELAKRSGVTPRQMQAAIWFGIKNQVEAGKVRPESPSFGTGIKEHITKRHDEALKENRKFDQKRNLPQQSELFDR